MAKRQGKLKKYNKVTGDGLLAHFGPIALFYI